MNDDLAGIVDALVVATAEYNRTARALRVCEATHAGLLMAFGRAENAKLDAEEALVTAVGELTKADA